MSLYNMVRGYNPTASLCLAMLDLPPGDVPRFRDSWLSDDGEKIIVLTRTGGGNRESYAEQNAALAGHPCYLDDVDDDFDSTFAHFSFGVPDLFRADARLIANAMAHAGKGAAEQGPGQIMKALDPPRPAGDAKPVTPDDPIIVAASEAYGRITELIAARVTPQADQA